ncbi:MAG: ABC transporter ATP-binding protein [Mariprofundaceae bacterium]
MITCNNLKKTYPKQLGEAAKQALDGISFTLKQGETLGFIGANGAGKSTCIRILMDFIRPTSGDLTVMGQSPKNPSLRQRVGYLPELASFPPNLTCMDLIRFAGQTTDMTKADTYEQGEYWLQRLKLYDSRNRLLRSFSKGMQQRASFAIALIHNPELLILDEPMSGLDPLGRAEIVSLIEELKDQGKSILFCSHLLNDVERLADNIMILHHGNVLLHGPTATLIQDHKDLEALFIHTINLPTTGVSTC